MRPLLVPHRDAVDGAVLPRVISLGGHLYAAAFQLMKLLPARFILRRAAERGLLRPETTIIETTSGTFGLGLAMVARRMGNPVVLVGDPALDATLRRRLTALGARVSIVAGEAARGSSVQQARLDRVARIQRRFPDHYTPQQYDNDLNPTSYGPVAELLAESLDRIDVLVCPVGSGGSSTGIGGFLRLLWPELRMVAVDTPGSVLFGAPPGQRLLRGLGSGILPKVLQHELFDEVHWVSAADAFAATRQLHAETCLFMGPSSGAAYLVGRWWRAREPGSRVVVVMPDEGHRYQRTVYSETWIRRNGLDSGHPCTAPIAVDHVSQVTQGWRRYRWCRRSLHEVLAESSSS